MNKVHELIFSKENAAEKAAFSINASDAIIELYFTKYWRNGSVDASFSSPKAIMDKVNALGVKTVLDVGCGFNEYKPLADPSIEFVAIDPFNDKADIKQSLEQYYIANPMKQFDVVLVLGSVNFGSENHIEYQLGLVDKLTRSGGFQFWRLNPGLNHKHRVEEFPLVSYIDFYPWTKERVDKYISDYGYNIVEFEYEANKVGDKRIYFMSHKP